MNTDNAYMANVHPRLLWNAGEVAGLRAKAGHPSMAALLEAVRGRCEGYLDPSGAAYIDTRLNRTELVGVTHGCGHTWQKLPDLILAALLTDDERYADLLTRVLRVFTQDGSPIKAYIFSHAPETGHDRSLLGGAQRNLTSQCGMIPLMLDLLWDRLDEGDRRAACEFLEREIVDPFLAFMLDDPRAAGFGQHLGINIGWWEFYSWLWSLAAIYDPSNDRHRRGLEAAAQRIRLGIHLGADEAGVVGEGPGYASIELFNWWTGAEVLRRAGVCDLWQSDQRFGQIMRTRVYYRIPNGHGILDHGDTARENARGFGNSMLIMLLHACRTGDPVFQQHWDQLAGPAEDRQAFPVGLHGPLGVLGYWLWYDPGIPAGPPRMEPSAWPLAPEAGRYGLHFVRGGWGEEDLSFAFFAAGRHPGTFIHQHTDAGHFALAALGEIFCAGRGYGHTLSSYHNVLRVNGREPPAAPDHANGQSWRGGYMLAAAHGAQSHYLAADLAWQWHCCWYHRHAMVVRMAGTEPYVVMLDHCNPANDWASYDWQFQVQRGYRAELRPGDARAVVQGRRHRLELAWATYGAGEYPKPHELELLMDRRVHIYAAAAGNHPHRSEERYECLIARLSGYSGVLLAALTPRREGQPETGIDRLYAPHQTAIVVDHGTCRDTIVAAPLVRRIALGGIEAEASLVVVRRGADGAVQACAAGDCFSLSVDGRILLRPEGRQRALFEWAHPGAMGRKGVSR